MRNSTLQSRSRPVPILLHAGLGKSPGASFLESIMSDERWLPVVGYEGIYEVSDQGRVRLSADRHGCKAGKVMSSRLNNSGYLMVDLRKGDTRSTFLVHRLVRIAFSRQYPIGMLEVNHKNGIKIDNRLENLEWCSHSDNLRHAHENGLHSENGETSRWAKLSQGDVIDIHSRVASGESKRSVGKRYNTTTYNITRIVTGKRWARVKKQIAAGS